MKTKHSKILFGALFLVLIILIFGTITFAFPNLLHKKSSDKIAPVSAVQTQQTQSSIPTPSVSPSENSSSQATSSTAPTGSTNKSTKSTKSNSSTTQSPPVSTPSTTIPISTPTPLPSLPQETVQALRLYYFASKTTISQSETIDFIVYLPAEAQGKITGVAWSTSGFTNTQIQSDRITAKWTPTAGAPLGKVYLGVSNLTGLSTKFSIVTNNVEVNVTN